MRLPGLYWALAVALAALGCADDQRFVPGDGGSTDSLTDGDGPPLHDAPVDAASMSAFRVEKRGDQIVAIRMDDGAEIFSDVDLDVVLEQVFAALPSDRTEPVKVVLAGTFVLLRTVHLPSYIRLDLSAAQISLGAKVNQAMFKNRDPVNGNTAIFIEGGTIDGNRDENTGAATYMVDEDDSRAVIYFNRVTDSRVERTHFRDARTHAVYAYRSVRISIDDIESRSSRSSAIMAWRGSDVSITNSTFSENLTSGIATATCPRTKILDNLVEQVRRDHSCISLNSEYSEVLRNRIDDGDGNGITVGHPGAEFNASHSVIAHNFISRLPSQGISMVNGSPNRDIFIHDNRIEDVDEGITIAGGTTTLGGVEDIVVAANTIARARMRGIRSNIGSSTSLRNIQIKDNIISNSGFAEATSSDVSSGIVLLGDTTTSYENVVVTGNRVFDDRMTKLQQYGVVVRRTTNCSIIDNDLRGNAVGPILVGAGNTNLTVSGNQ